MSPKKNQVEKNIQKNKPALNASSKDSKTSKSAKNTDRLGRGLSALFSATKLTEKDKLIEKKERILDIEIQQIHPNSKQPRKYFDKNALQELATSMKQVGLIQPIVVRGNAAGEYELVAGERRFRAAQILQGKTITAFIESQDDKMLFEKMLIENIQREDLSPFEEAIAYRTLMETHKLLQEQVADLVGKSRSHVANIMRLSKLPLNVQNLLHEGKISFGIARALINLDEKRIKPLLKKIVQENLTVREVEKQVARLQKTTATVSGSKNTQKSSENQASLLELEELFREKLGTKIKISDLKKNVGKVEIEYYSYDHLAELIEKIK